MTAPLILTKCPRCGWLTVEVRPLVTRWRLVRLTCAHCGYVAISRRSRRFLQAWRVMEAGR